jgi:hypothetical protein
MLLVNFKHYYTFCFCGHAFCHNKTVDFNLLALLLHILCTRVGEICAHNFLIHVHTSYFIMLSFSLTLNDHKCILFVLIFLGMLRQQADCHTAKGSNVTNVCA